LFGPTTRGRNCATGGPSWLASPSISPCDSLAVARSGVFVRAGSVCTLFLSGLYSLAAPAAPAGDVAGCPTSNARAPEWDRDCALAIETESDPVRKAELHFRRAYVLNERQAYQDALSDLNVACTLIPRRAAGSHDDHRSVACGCGRRLSGAGR